MSLTKRHYTENETVITAQNMNDIQDAIIDLEDGLFSVDNDKRGEIITITDGAKRGFRSFNIYGKTTQDGTPTPDAPVDLVSAGKSGAINVSVAGKNLLAEPFVIGVYKPNGYGANDTVISTNGMYLKAGTYAISANGTSACNLFVNGMTDATHTSGYQISYGQNRVITILEDGLYNIQFNKPSATETFTGTELQSVNASAQLEFGSTATEYEPYKGQTFTISTPNGLPGIPVTSGGNYTDSNGQQWICDEIDLARGVYVKRIEKFTLAVADMDNTEGYPGWKNSGISEYYHEVNGVLGSMGSVSMCNIDSNPKGTVYVNTLLGGNIVLIPNPKGMTQSEWKAQYPELVFELIFSIPTPIETPLSEEELAAYAALHTYREHTTVSNDAGAYMELEYVMDAKKYIDSQISAGILAATVE